MPEFGHWLQDRALDSIAQAVELRGYAGELADKWPRDGASQDAYDRALSEAFASDPRKRDEAIAALRSLWAVYRTVNVEPAPATAHKSWLDQLIANIPALAIFILVALILVSFGQVFKPDTLKEIAKLEVARGLLMLLFGVTTVAIASIVAVMVFLGNGTSEELRDRFQRGKDVLTVLIGVFGAILGFYFGSDSAKEAQTNPGISGARTSGAASPTIVPADAAVGGRQNNPAPANNSPQRAIESDLKPGGTQPPTAPASGPPQNPETDTSARAP